MRISVLFSYFLVVLVLLLSFCQTPFFTILIPGITLLLFILNQYNGKVLMKTVIQNPASKKSKYQGYDLYIVDKKAMGNHNIAVAGFQNPIIFVEEEVKNSLSRECVNALLLHEVGHICQKNRGAVLVLKYVGMACTCVGLNNSIYGDSMFLNIICIVGVSIVLIIQIAEKRNEYLADQYAVEHGAAKEELIQGLLMIEQMNGKRKMNMDMTHPALEKRIKRLNNNSKSRKI